MLTKKALILLMIGSIFISCFKQEELSYSFYHWKNTFKATTYKKAYIKVLDVDFHGKLNMIKTRFLKPAPKDFVAVVYIGNKTFKNVDTKEFAKKILKSLEGMRFSELQIDCDWSLSTKYAYFEFLKYLKKHTKKTLSATIRLHQVKYHQKTGTPPVDYGILMYYNMSSVGDFNTTNSILDNKIAKKYHFNFDTYKLRLKLALPLYSQGIWFRNKRPIGIIEGLGKKDFDTNFEKLDKNFYKVKNNFYFKGRYIYENDIIRFEEVKKEALKVALKDFFKKAKNPYREVIFYTHKYKNRFDIKTLLKEF